MAQEAQDEKKKSEAHRTSDSISEEEWNKYSSSCDKIREKIDDIITNREKYNFKLSQESSNNEFLKSKLSQKRLSKTITIKTKTYSCNIHPQEPTLFLSETIVPGNIKKVFDAWIDPSIRQKWDKSSLNSHQTFFDKNCAKKDENDNKNNDDDVSLDKILLWSNDTAPAAGGLVSARNFVSLVKIGFEFDKMGDVSNARYARRAHTSSHFIEHDKYKIKKGFVRGQVIRSGVTMRRIDIKNEKDCQMFDQFVSLTNKKSKNSGSGNISDDIKKWTEWIKVTDINQVKIGGWVSDKISAFAMGSFSDDTLKAHRLHMFDQL